MPLLYAIMRFYCDIAVLDNFNGLCTWFHVLACGVMFLFETDFHLGFLLPLISAI